MDQGNYRLIAPRFHGVIELPSDIAGELRDGQVGDAKFSESYESIGGWAYRKIAAWVQGKHQARAS